jgi:hypothetical protein
MVTATVHKSEQSHSRIYVIVLIRLNAIQVNWEWTENCVIH